MSAKTRKVINLAFVNYSDEDLIMQYAFCNNRKDSIKIRNELRARGISTSYRNLVKILEE